MWTEYISPTRSVRRDFGLLVCVIGGRGVCRSLNGARSEKWSGDRKLTVRKKVRVDSVDGHPLCVCVCVSEISILRCRHEHASTQLHTLDILFSTFGVLYSQSPRSPIRSFAISLAVDLPNVKTGYRIVYTCPAKIFHKFRTVRSLYLGEVIIIVHRRFSRLCIVEISDQRTIYTTAIIL